MARVNAKKVVEKEYTHGGAVASRVGSFDTLVRTVHANLLWEDAFYENGQSSADRIKALVPQCSLTDVAALAVAARTVMKLRHVPLLLVREMARHPDVKKNHGVVAETLFSVIQRPDEIAEFVSIYWKDKKQPLSKQVKTGLAAAFTKFNEYSLAKYDQSGKEISLRDVMFLVHAKPSDVTDDMAKWNKDARKLYDPKNGFIRDFTKGELLFGKLVNGALETPDTWEVELSAGKDKKETFERLMRDGKLGALAFLRNLRGMLTAGVSETAIKEYADKVNVERVLPFRFISAAKHAPRLEPILEKMMFRCSEGLGKLKGKTVLILDISGSMQSSISSKSDVSRLETAYALAILAREMCEDVQIYCTAGNDSARIHATDLVPARRGFALADACKQMNRTLGGGGIFLTQVMDYVYSKEKTADRVLVLTDEQDCDTKCKPENAKAFGTHNYIINVASYQNGIGYGKWTHITGWSEAILDYIRVVEDQN